jgi:hypothetical protein
MGKKTQVFKQKIWSLKHADTKFSLFIRARDGKCQRDGCSTGSLDNSHYWRRDMWGTRFDPDNCVALARNCHTIWERHQNPEYKQFMINRLGQKKYNELEQRARAYKGRRNAIMEVMTLI